MTKGSLSGATLALVSMLGLFPASCSATTIFSFSESGPATGTVSGSTVSGVDFNTIIYNSQSYTVNQFVESYSNGVLTFAVAGGGNLAVAGLFDNVSGTFLTINESAPLFGNNPLSLFTAVTSLSISSAFLSDIGLASGSNLVLVSGTNISVTTQSGNVISTDAAFSLAQVPDPSTFSTLGIGLLLLGCLAGRRKKHPVPCKETNFG